MAKTPSSLDELNSRFGPHLNYTPPGGWAGESGKQAEKLVKTHCCFCGQQCGIQLKVRDNRVTGFEPWEDFPFNRGHALPQGRQALPAGQSSRPPSRSADENGAGIPGGERGTRLSISRRGVSANSRRSTARILSRSTAAPRSPPRRRT